MPAEQNPLEMRRRRADLIDRAAEIANTAVSEARVMTADELRQFDTLIEQAEGMLPQIRELEEQRASERKLERRSLN